MREGLKGGQGPLNIEFQQKRGDYAIGGQVAEF